MAWPGALGLAARPGLAQVPPARLPRVLPTSALAPPGSQTVVLVAGQPVVLPVMGNAGRTLYAIDLAQVGAPGDPLVQAELASAPAGLLAGLAASWDQATVLLAASGALAAGTLAIDVTTVFASGATMRVGVALPVTAASPLAAAPDGALTLNGFALTVGGQGVALGDADAPLTLESSPVTVGDTTILLGA